MTEDELLALVLAECGRHGLLVHHCRDSRHCDGTPGIPDLIIASFKGVIFAELKSRDGETTADQDLWHYVLFQASHPGRGYPPFRTELLSVRFRLWHPGHWHAGDIQRTLAELVVP